MNASKEHLTQEKLEEFFFKIIEELRNENIPILNDFSEIFANIKYKDEMIVYKDFEEDESVEEEDNEEEEEKT